MGIDLSCETPVSFNQAAQFLPHNCRPSYSTWWRWWRHGIRGVRLETVLIGGRRFTTYAAVLRFSDHLSALAGKQADPAATPHQRCQEIERAEAELRKEGVHQ